jgi:hypothetical protein
MLCDLGGTVLLGNQSSNRMFGDYTEPGTEISILDLVSSESRQKVESILTEIKQRSGSR